MYYIFLENYQCAEKKKEDCNLQKYAENELIPARPKRNKTKTLGKDFTSGGELSLTGDSEEDKLKNWAADKSNSNFNNV